jgi:sulfur carrier protein ThiS
MATIVEINNPFEPMKETRVSEHPGGITIKEWLEQNGGLPRKQQFVCIINGKHVPVTEWEFRRIAPDDVVNIVAQVGYNFLIYAVIALVAAAAVAIALSVPKPTIPGQLPEADPVFDLKGQKNQIRLGSPIEVPYGRNRLWPSYAARPYNQYIGNDQYLFQLFCVGQGEYDDFDSYIEDTPLGNFPGVEWAIYPPGEPVVLFPDNVITSVEVTGVELFGSNQSEFAGESGPYVLNPANTDANRLEVDVVLPGGLYFAGSDGKLKPRTVTAEFEYQEIDDSGTPIGSWTVAFLFSQTLQTNTPQRFTLGVDVTPGRYQIRGMRTNVKDTDTNASDMLRWDGARAFLPSTKDYGDVTLYALKIRATNNLNDKSSSRFNTWATRKLPIYDSGTEIWSAPVATRSIVWAFCDVFRSAYGGRLDDEFFDLEALLALETVYDGLGWNFDFVFDQRIGVWEAAKVIARAGRAVPMLDISRVTMIRDYLQTVVSAVYNQENIVKDTFKLDTVFADQDEYDGVEMEFTNPNTGLPDYVKCLVGDDAGENCEQIKFPGCRDRNRAFEEGMYIRRTRLLQRQNITFETTLEGRVPKYGNLIKVIHDTPKWGQGGLVKSIVGTTVTLNEPVVFTTGTHKIGFRTRLGVVIGPYTVTAGAAPNIVELDSPIYTGELLFDDNTNLPLFYFGKANEDGTICKIVGLAPGEDTVEVKAVVVDNSIYGDSDTPPTEIVPVVPPPVPDVPVLLCSSVIARQNPLDVKC